MLNTFFLLSGENKSLPFAELRAILEAENIFYLELEQLPQVLRLTTSEEAFEAVERRAALTRIGCVELLRCLANFNSIAQATQLINFEEILQNSDSFAVRIKRVAGSIKELKRSLVEKKIGELILKKTYKRVKVDLKQPKKTFFGVITNNVFLLGLMLGKISPTPFVDRRPIRKPFFHPSAMPAKLARCMVNLARPRKHDLLLDPFCGSGSFLIEAGLLGCRVLGVDADMKMVKGSIQNLDSLCVEYDGFILADAKQLPLTKVDCIVTDPPYGRSASTMGYSTREIIIDFLASFGDGINRGRRLCLAAPKTIHIPDVIAPLGFKHIQSHFVYVHRSLTREIVVLERS